MVSNHMLKMTDISGIARRANSGSTAPYLTTKSQNTEPSPAMFPRAQGDANREMNVGTAPPFTTALVCSYVPEAMLVRAQADSN